MQKNLDPHLLTAQVVFPIAFFDVDSMQIVWHGNYFKFFEHARCALLEKIGYTYQDMEAEGYAFPVAESTIKYLHPLRFGDTCCAKAILDKYEHLLKINFELYNVTTGRLTTTGSISHMCVHLKTNKSRYVCPESLIKKVETHILAGGFLD